MGDSKQSRNAEMAPKERLNALLAGQPIDRIPFILGFCARNVGYPVSSIYNDPKKSFLAQLWTMEMYGYDGYPIYGYASYGSWEFGGEVRFPTSQYEQAPMITHFPVESEEDVKKLNLPDVRKAGMLPFAMEFSKISQKFGMPVSIVMGGVFTIAGSLCKLEALCRWMIQKPELVHSLLRLAADHILDVVHCWVDTFGTSIIVHIWEPLAANQIISPKQFENFVLPYQREVHKKILATGIKHILCHACGEQNLNLQYWAQIPMGDPGIISVGAEVDLDTAIRYFGDTCVIAGNIEPAIIQEGTPEQVSDLARQCIEKAKHAPRGYILMAGCEVPVMTPPYHIYILKKAVNDFGLYD